MQSYYTDLARDAKLSFLNSRTVFLKSFDNLNRTWYIYTFMSLKSRSVELTEPVNVAKR